MTQDSSVDLFFAQMSRFPVLEPHETIALAQIVQKWQQYEDGVDAAPAKLKRAGIRARNKLVSHNLRLIVRVWKQRYSVNLLPMRREGVSDAFQCAAMGLQRAAEKFSPKAGYTFSTYACNWIVKGFNDYLNSEQRTIRIPINSLHILRAAKKIQEREQLAGRPDPTMEELYDELRETRKHVLKPKQLGEYLQNMEITRCASFSSPVQGCNLTIEDLVGQVENPDLGINDSVEAQALRSLPEIELKVLQLKHKQRGGIGQKTIAKHLHITVAEVIQIEESAMSRLHDLIAA
jgi:RNA polymerase sigma factor (sigma-70 family)|tara:strand:+ start:1940 stop:2812 length:873 start_codon:yes stop_codon:yes gene_type:complete